MKIGISTKLFAAVLVTSALVVTVVGGASRWNFERGFLGYLNELAADRVSFVLPRLADAYAKHGNWDFLRDQRSMWFSLLRPQPGQELSASADDSAAPLLNSDLTGAILRLGLLDAQQQWVAGLPERRASTQQWPIQVKGQTVGWLLLTPFQEVADAGARRFQRSQTEAALGTTLLALMLAALIAWWVSRWLADPLRRVAAATHQLAAGQHDVRVEVDSDDEVGQLARDFNHLALTLERSSALRREFVADISHELRTPLAVLRGELEAMEDGVRPLDRTGLASLQAEAGQLTKLVDDLYELALSDAGALTYRMQTLDLAALLQRAVESQRRAIEEQGLSIDWRLQPDAGAAPGASIALRGDQARLQQLLTNLLQNSRRYTDAPGRIELLAHREGQEVCITVQDSAPGVAPELLARLFDRLFRVDNSRNRASGGAGLGLAICRNIVLAHEGHIEARASPLGGVAMHIRLPCA